MSNFTERILQTLIEEVLEEHKDKSNKEIATKITHRLRGQYKKRLVISK